MKRYFFSSLLLVLFLISANHSIAEIAPISAKIPSFKLSDEAIAFTKGFHARELIKDEIFIDSLQTILNSGLNEQAKIDSFVILLDKIGWLFNGSVRLFPGGSYVETYYGIVSTYIKYQKAFKNINYNVTGILEIASKSCEENTISCSNALLLATILDKKASSQTISQLSTVQHINNSKVPAIFLHNLTLSAVLSRNIKLIEKLLDIVSEIKIEEGREDILSAAGIYNYKPFLTTIKTFARKQYLENFDNSVQTAIIIIRKKSPPKEFDVFFKSLKTGDKKKIREESLNLMVKNNFKGPLQSQKRSWIKTWDGFDVTVYEDGMHLSLKDRFSHFRSNNK